jgi:hypothetical protein
VRDKERLAVAVKKNAARFEPGEVEEIDDDTKMSITADYGGYNTSTRGASSLSACCTHHG